MSERLRIAIEKARAQRSEAAAQPAATAAAASAGGAPAPAMAEAPPRAAPPSRSGTPPRRTLSRGVDAAVADRWAALDPVPPARKRPGIVPETGPAGSAYALLRTRVLQQARRNGWRRVALVSPDPGDGKTTLAANLASGLTRQTDLRALVLDLDLRRIGLSKVFANAAPPEGMDAVLTGEAPFARAARRLGDNVALGLNHHPVAQPAEILQSSGAIDSLMAVEADYAPDIVLIDLPPLLIGQDNFGFLENADCALIVVSAEHTPMARIDTAERQVAELTEVMGIVLNKCRYPDRTNGYDYY